MRPKFVFAENSPLLRTRGLGVVLEDLASLGYNARWGVLGARDVGAPHKRDRMWVLAYAGREGVYKRRQSPEVIEVGSIKNGIQPDGVSSFQEQERKDLADPASLGQSGSGEYERPSDPAENRQGEADQSVDASEGKPQWWVTEPDVGRVAHGVAYRVDRLKATGNGQVPQCAAMAFRVLSEGLI
jgi:DNA (cytosine-5)-methyltransferase 1